MRVGGASWRRMRKEGGRMRDRLISKGRLDRRRVDGVDNEKGRGTTIEGRR